MKVTDLDLPGLRLVELDLHGDKRGFFVERFNLAAFKQHGLPTEFAQDNHSRSAPGVIRGLHYQYDPPQSKLIGVVCGRIWDVVLDLRPGSPTYGRSYATELSDENARLLWVPAGFAHGFGVLGNTPADVFYKVDVLYRPQGEAGIHWADPDLGIHWPIENPIVSTRDQALPRLSEYRKNPFAWK